MKQIKNELLLVSIGAASLFFAACSSSKPASNGDGGGGTGGGGCVLVASATGFLDGTNSCAVLGPWYAYADGYADGASTTGGGKCQLAGHTDCSTFVTPTPGMPFAPNASGAMCAMGHAAQVPPMGASFDYSNVYGAAIALDLNNAGADGGTAGVKGSYNPTTKSPPITGVSFDIDMPPTNALRVELPTNAVPATNGAGGTSNDAAWWGGGTQNASPVKALPGHNSFKWADVGGPMYLTNPPAFDVTQLTSIKFHVVTNMNAPIDFQFCISNLTLTTN